LPVLHTANFRGRATALDEPLVI